MLACSPDLGPAELLDQGGSGSQAWLSTVRSGFFDTRAMVGGRGITNYGRCFVPVTSELSYTCASPARTRWDVWTWVGHGDTHIGGSRGTMTKA